MTEIEVEAVGMPNFGNSGAWAACETTAGRTSVLAVGCGMTVRQFAKLPLNSQQAVQKAI
ncbi:hypothetical protein [Mesorhizobium sp.]|uniref:hypothetical protein n=2 Tax=unclassified Mesorhizobium TaxID=325217 RepID=UPI000FE90D1B|nr:hypothetical protein [Mesorhizobium sp.]RWD62433.1 MAG: hypothetical protein EOS37_30890 [Mesorhizobium sp.]RWE79266.1 MAG: hypothetical protein EOS42_02215 [Mesorhizobium sp.]TIV32927.1 MAG: hypothetical protein E5V90_00925 [Mesorhizobium sp.]TIV61944.1 MAG: hypothetical protein E5V80_02375 [Mesorhizobium sp.]